MALGGMGRGRRRRHLNAEVNIINLVDVVLVLLIVFMVTAPMMQTGVDVELPVGEVKPMEVREALTITVTSDGRIAMDDAVLSYDEFRSNLATVLRLRAPERVNLRGDTRANWGTMTRVMSALVAAGIHNVGIVAEPERTR